MWPTWRKFLAVGKRYQKHAPAGTKFIDSGSNLYNAMVAQASPGYYSKTGKVIVKSNPKVKAAWNTDDARRSSSSEDQAARRRSTPTGTPASRTGRSRP